MAADLTGIKTEARIYSELCNLVSNWFVSSGFDGWIARRWGQPKKRGLSDRLCLIDFYSSKRYGLTADEYKWDAGEHKGTGKVYWKRDLNLSFSFFKDFKPEEGNAENFVSAQDLANAFLAYIQSDKGREDLAALGYFTVHTFLIANPSFEDDSGNYARFPVIRTVFVIEEYLDNDETENFIGESEALAGLRQIEIVEV